MKDKMNISRGRDRDMTAMQVRQKFVFKKHSATKQIKINKCAFNIFDTITGK